MAPPSLRLHKNNTRWQWEQFSLISLLCPGSVRRSYNISPLFSVQAESRHFLAQPSREGGAAKRGGANYCQYGPGSNLGHRRSVSAAFSSQYSHLLTFHTSPLSLSLVHIFSHFLPSMYHPLRMHNNLHLSLPHRRHTQFFLPPSSS